MNTDISSPPLLSLAWVLGTLTKTPKASPCVECVPSARSTTKRSIGLKF